jgi:hypothetical protein
MDKCGVSFFIALIFQLKIKKNFAPPSGSWGTCLSSPDGKIDPKKNTFHYVNGHDVLFEWPVVGILHQNCFNSSVKLINCFQNTFAVRIVSFERGWLLKLGEIFDGI